MRDDGIELSGFSWGRADLSGPTDRSELKLIELPNGDYLIVQTDSGPETEKLSGSYDYERTLQISSSETAVFTARVLAKLIDGSEPCLIEDLEDLLDDWAIKHKKDGRALP